VGCLKKGAPPKKTQSGLFIPEKVNKKPPVFTPRGVKPWKKGPSYSPKTGRPLKKTCFRRQFPSFIAGNQTLFIGEAPQRGEKFLKKAQANIEFRSSFSFPKGAHLKEEQFFQEQEGKNCWKKFKRGINKSTKFQMDQRRNGRD